MAEQSAAERTEEPTPKRLADARKKGQIARSRELNTTAMLLAGAVGLLSLGPWVGEHLAEITTRLLSIEASLIGDPMALLRLAFQAIGAAFLATAPILMLAAFVAATAPMMLGGFSFSAEGFAPKFSRMDPLKGLGRMFGVQGLVELGKALAKVTVVSFVAGLFLWDSAADVLALATQPLATQFRVTFELLGVALLLLALATAPIAALDVPYQLWEHSRKLKMTRQEVIDELKQTEGRPEVKQRIRRLQEEMSRARMMAELPTADVVVTNPTHYAAALRYDDEADGAPRLIAKGVDEVAAVIREAAAEHSIPLLEAPPLARALYAGTELGEEVPTELYAAVAQVLAWVYGVDAARREGRAAPVRPEALPVPDHLDPVSDDWVRPQRRRRR